MNRRSSIHFLATCFFTLAFASAVSSQNVVADNEYEPALPHPAYSPGMGPRVGIDEAHQNSQTIKANLTPLVKLLRKDGYRVREFSTEFTDDSLRSVDLLLIVNALSRQNATNAGLPASSAFTSAEIDAVARWVSRGGSLLLAAGHMPWPGCAEAMAARFDVFFQNGFTFPRDPKSGDLVMSGRADKQGLARSLPVKHPIFAGRSPEEYVPSILSGAASQALRLRPGGRATPLLLLHGEWMLLFPEKQWEFSDKTPRVRADAMPVAATVLVGKGRVVALGLNAAVLTAQVVESTRKPWGIGFNHPSAPHNAQFVLNMMHWLSGLLPAE